MKYSFELMLNKPRAEAWKGFSDPANLSKWQPLLVKIEQLEGNSAQPGSVAKLTFKNGEREYSLIEKITNCIEPERLDQLYQNEFADNTIKNSFMETGNNKTRWKVDVEFTFKTIAMRLIGPFVKKRFVANTQRDMERFKAFIENK
jgi:hypothetical protein